MTDYLKTIAENTAKFGGGNIMTSRYYDLIQPAKNNIPEKSSKEIISNIRRKLEKMRGEQNG